MDTTTLLDLVTRVAVLIACLPVLVIALLFPLGFGRFILAGGGQTRARSGKRLMWAAAIVAALATALFATIFALTRLDKHLPTYELARHTSQTQHSALGTRHSTLLSSCHRRFRLTRPLGGCLYSSMVSEEY